MQMMDIRARLRKDLAIAMRTQADYLSAGRATDFATYQKYVGCIRGLQTAIDVIDQVFSKIIDEGGDEDPAV